MNFRRLITIDPSLTCSGWALFGIERRELMAVGKVRSLGAQMPLAHRLEDLQGKIKQVFDGLELASSDVLVCEAPTTMRDPHAAFKVEQVRGIFESVARSRKIKVPGRINPRSVHLQIMGMQGKQLPRAHIKEAAVTLVASLYRRELTRMKFECSAKMLKRNQDIVDAILIGSLALAWVSEAGRGGVALEDYFDPRQRQRSAGKVLRR
jgi:Holliday junction resolvasome RuvABC endonuclease subunit